MLFPEAESRTALFARSCVIASSLAAVIHAAVAPARNQMSHRESIGSAPRFSTRCIVPEATPPSERTRVVREPNRGVYDRETIYKILDEGFVCHVGFSVDGQPYVIPTLFARVGHALYFHGSAASRMLRNLGEGLPVCVTVTLTDGFVLARSVFNHSMNYRSEEHTSELQSLRHLVCRLLLEKKKKKNL